MGTVILEAKLLMQLAFHGYRPLFQIFLDLLTKAYDTLDRDHSIKTLQGYGPHVCHLISCIWEKLMLPLCALGFYGNAFHPECDVLQGDLDSPIIFNIQMDCVICEWMHITNNLSLVAVFYADNGQLAGYSPVSIQQGLDVFQSLFAHIGLHLNADKTKTMILECAQPYGAISSAAFKRRYDHSLPSY